MKGSSDTPDIDAVRTTASKEGRELDDIQASGLTEYLSELMKWNRRLNLVGASDWRRTLRELVADSWHLADFLSGIEMPDDPLSLDIGAGAGLPGVPLRLFWNAGEYVMVEPRQKRAAFLAYILSRLGLNRTRVVRAKAEELDSSLRGADLVLGRAVMQWRDFLSLSAELLAPGGFCVIFSNTPEPADAPSGFIPGPRAAYIAAGKKRYFWSFSLETPVNCSK